MDFVWDLCCFCGLYARRNNNQRLCSPKGIAIGDGYLLTDMLLSVDPSVGRKHIAKVVAGNGLAIIAGLQITPCGITIGVVDGTLCKTKDPKIYAYSLQLPVSTIAEVYF